MITRVQAEPDLSWFPGALFLVLLNSWLAGHISGWWCWLPLGMVFTARTIAVAVQTYRQNRLDARVNANRGVAK